MEYLNEYPNETPHALNSYESGYLASVYGYFALALLITAAGTFGGFWLAGNNPELFVNPAIFYGAIVIELILAFTAHAWSRNLPFGYGMFIVYALLSGFTLVPLLALAGATGGAMMIVKALFAATCVFVACAAYGAVTNRNILGMGGFLFMAIMGLIAISIIGIFIPWGNTMEIIVSGAGILIFSGFVMYDIQVIQRTNLASPLLGAIMLYISFIGLFANVLRFMIAFGGRD